MKEGSAVPGRLAREGSYGVEVFVALGALAGFVLFVESVRVPVLLISILVLGIYALRSGRHVVSVLAFLFLLRALIILVDARTGMLMEPPISMGHHLRASGLARSWLSGAWFDLPGDKVSLRTLVAYLYAPFYLVLGESKVVGELASATFGVAAGFVLYLIGREVTDRRTASIALLIVLLWPSLLYRSTVIQREIVVVVLMLTAVLLAVRWVERMRSWEIPLLLVIVWAMFVLRKENLAIIFVTLGTALVLRGRRSPRYLLGASVVSLPFLGYFVTHFGSFTGAGTSLTPEALDTYAHARAHGDAAYLTWLHYDSWLDVVTYLPIKVAYFLYSPLPWQIDSVADVLAGVSGLSALLLTVLILRRLLSVRFSDKVFVLATYLVTGVAAYSIVEMNFGAAFRRRIQFVPVLVLFGVMAISYVHIRLSILKHEASQGN